MAAKALPLTYFGNLSYFKNILDEGQVWIDDREIYLKQTFRNRTQILAANGVLNLSVPIMSTKGEDVSIDKIKISYDDPWQQKHFKTIKSAYKSSPFFDDYEGEIKGLILKKHVYLTDLNNEILNKIIELLGLRKEIHYSSQQAIPQDAFSYRGYFKPSKTPSSFNQFKPYLQVFNYKFDFIPNLSILDLLFNEGPYSLSYLLNSSKDKTD